MIVITILFVAIATLVLLQVPNRSNIPAEYIIPVIVALLTKYAMGDWDKGFQWSMMDIVYWVAVLGLSYGIVTQFTPL
jgi:hypothetical protein